MLDREVAAGFLLARTGAAGAAEEQAAGELAAELGGLPLALEQAAAYMESTGRGMRTRSASALVWPIGPSRRRSDQCGRAARRRWRVIS